MTERHVDPRRLFVARGEPDVDRGLVMEMKGVKKSFAQEFVLTPPSDPGRFPTALVKSSAGSKAWRRESRVPYD